MYSIIQGEKFLCHVSQIYVASFEKVGVFLVVAIQMICICSLCAWKLNPRAHRLLIVCAFVAFLGRNEKLLGSLQYRLAASLSNPAAEVNYLYNSNYPLPPKKITKKYSLENKTHPYARHILNLSLKNNFLILSLFWEFDIFFSKYVPIYS